jgi:hypothetical protein
MRRLVWFVIAACSSSGVQTRHEARDHKTQVQPAPRPPDDHECDALIAHAVELRMNELPAISDAHVPTAADRDYVQGELRAAFGPECHRVTRAAYQCAMAATTTAELTACDR